MNANSVQQVMFSTRCSLLGLNSGTQQVEREIRIFSVTDNAGETKEICDPRVKARMTFAQNVKQSSGTQQVERAVRISSVVDNEEETKEICDPRIKARMTFRQNVKQSSGTQQVEREIRIFSVVYSIPYFGHSWKR